MGIKVGKDALEYIKTKGGMASIRYSIKGWCHTGNVGVPIIHLGEPENNLEDYQKINLQGIILYISKEINLDSENLKITLSKLFRWKKLTLEGAKIRK